MTLQRGLLGVGRRQQSAASFLFLLPRWRNLPRQGLPVSGRGLLWTAHPVQTALPATCPTSSSSSGGLRLASCFSSQHRDPLSSLPHCHLAQPLSCPIHSSPAGDRMRVLFPMPCDVPGKLPPPSVCLWLPEVLSQLYQRKFNSPGGEELGEGGTVCPGRALL